MPQDPRSPGTSREASPVRLLPDANEPQLSFNDPTQQRYEIIRPLVLFHDRTAKQRAQETDTHPDTVGTLKRRLAAQGMLGLLPATLEVIPAGRRRRVPVEVVHELQRLKGLSEGFGDRALARIIWHPLARRLPHPTVQPLWQELPPTAPQPWPLRDSHSYAERSQARLQGIALSAPGGRKHRIRQFLPVSRPPITAWMARFEADNLESLEDKSRAPHTTG